MCFWVSAGRPDRNDKVWEDTDLGQMGWKEWEADIRAQQWDGGGRTETLSPKKHRRKKKKENQFLSTPRFWVCLSHAETFSYQRPYERLHHMAKSDATGDALPETKAEETHEHCAPRTLIRPVTCQHKITQALLWADIALLLLKTLTAVWGSLQELCSQFRHDHRHAVSGPSRCFCQDVLKDPEAVRKKKSFFIF